MIEGTNYFQNYKCMSLIHPKLVHRAFSCPEWFVFTSGIVFLITGMAKFVMALSKVQVLYSRDPVFNITFQNLEFITGAVELTLAILCLFFFKKWLNTLLWLIFLTAINFLFYHAVLWVVGWNGSCPCLGNLASVFRLSDQLVQKISIVISIYLLAGVLVSWLFLFIPELMDRH